ncbi:FixH family protein [Parendozoicomonas sp. Alg238-R29]|uniref:FixH family protein n=1 Tax=Parendozoicomonas sp. Alg238-R29 TaxID=2993446 RepID=UPI00248F43F4|nr:FixH family protein [Parendozoicomonas sp. Alg238-R29]
MTPNAEKEPFTYWYQEPWAWYIVGVILVTITWGTFQVIVSFKNADEVVVDDYYKVGKAINQDLSRDRRAHEQNIAANINFDEASGSLNVAMSGSLDSWPQQLRLRLLPAAKGVEKQVIALLQTPAQNTLYKGQSQGIPAGRYYVHLETLDEITPEKGYLSGWRLNREIWIEENMPVELAAYE